MPTSIDVFAKAREFERLELLGAARELDMLPYFRVLEGPTLPVVEMEGKRRIMLGSNNYLGLTGDERVKQGAVEALNRYGTGLTGSRFLNGTIDLHLELEQALGVLGARGAGTCELLGVEDRVDLRMATFSKSLASCGGVIAGSAEVIEFLRIQARPFMFTASAVPAAVGAALAAVRICRSEEGKALFARVLDNARYLHAGLSGLGFKVVEPTRLADGSEIVTPIVPVVVGDDW